MSQQLTSRGLAAAGLSALVVSALALVVAVLPAEFGIDPLGAGKRLGLDRLARPDVAAHQLLETRWRTDRITLVLDPFASVEYKYPMTASSPLVYHWSADAELVFDFHSEEEGRDPEAAISWQQGRDVQANGAYTAPFNGIHGWFWENRGTAPVTLTLETAGNIHSGLLYEGGFAHSVPLNPLALPVDAP